MIDEATLIQQEAQWEKEKNLLERKFKIRKEKRDIVNKNKTSTTKLLIAFLFINCTLIELFTGWVTIKNLNLSLITGVSPDFTPLTTLIGAIVGEVIGFAVYAIKSSKENSKNGITYELAMLQQQQDIKG